MSTMARGSEDSGLSAGVESTSWLRAGASALMPAAVGTVYALAALHPDRVSDRVGLALAAYFLSQLASSTVPGSTGSSRTSAGPEGAREATEREKERGSTPPECSVDPPIVPRHWSPLFLQVVVFPLEGPPM